MINRRQLLKRLPSIPFLGAIIGTGALTIQEAAAKNPAGFRDFYKELGLRSFINAAGTYTFMSASLMEPETAAAWQYASQGYVILDDIQDRVGERISSLLRCEAATVTAGAASAMTLGTAGVLAGTDPKKVIQIPDLTGMKSEVIIQKSHDVGYTHAIRNCGVKMVYVETRKELEAAISDKTAMLLFINASNNEGQVKDIDFVKVGKQYGIPTFNDCAADVPPKENLWKYTEMGFDLVCFSGGKGLRGPQSAGLLLGKKDLIAAARLHAAPRGNTVGRGMKVNKEEILAMMVALEVYLTKDHDAEWKLWESQINLISDSAKKVPGVSTEIHVPPIANHVPSLRIRWDQQKVPITPGKVREALRNGHPSIETMGGNESVDITTWMMRPGEERVVASRIQEILAAAK